MRVLLPTDFSKTAHRSLEYINELFGNQELEICLLHTYGNPDSTTGILINVVEILKADTEKMMQEYLEKCTDNYPNIRFSSLVIQGDLVQQVNSLCHTNNYDYVVTGTNGATGLEEVFIGSNTSSLISRGDFPLIAVPKNTLLNPPQKITIALDLKPIDQNVIEELKKLQNIAELPLELITVSENSSKQEEIIETYNLTFPNAEIKVIENDNIEQGLNQHLSENRNSLLVIINRKRTFFKRLFHKSISKKLSMHFDIPMLILHD